jgi:hypothetical protein
MLNLGYIRLGFMLELMVGVQVRTSGDRGMRAGGS